MIKRALFVVSLLCILALAANAEMVSRESLGPLHKMTLGSDTNMFIEATPQQQRQVPPEGVHSVQTGIDYGDGSVSTPVAYQEERHIVIAPNTVPENPEDPAATWVIWETGALDDREVYSKYYHSFYFFWDGPYVISDSEVDAGRPAMTVTDNGWLHCVYHGDHDATGAYEIAYANHTGAAFSDWMWQEIISTNDDEGMFPTIMAEGNDLWVAYERFWQAPNQELDLQHGVWDEGTETMTWWASEDIKTITVSEAGWFYGSMDVCPAGLVHMAYGNSDDNLTYRIFDPVADDFTAAEEVVDIGPEGGECFSPSLVVDSQGEVHIVYPYSYYGGEAGNLGTANYVHGTYGDWSEPEFIHHWQGTVDTFSTYPVIGIDPGDGLWVTYTNLYGWEEAGSGSFQLYLNHKKAGSDEWEGWYMTKPEGEGYPDDLPGYYVYNEVPNYPSITHDIPWNPAGYATPNMCFAEYDEETQTSSVYVVVPPAEVGIKDAGVAAAPQNVSLKQNYPNPFNPTTSIDFELSKKAHVELNVYNAAGELVKTLVDGEKEASYHTVSWNGTDEAGNTVPSGVYVYTLKTGDRSESNSMILLK